MGTRLEPGDACGPVREDRMASLEATQFIRLMYDDRKKFPWIVLCNGVPERACRDREAATWRIKYLRNLIDEFAEWKEFNAP